MSMWLTAANRAAGTASGHAMSAGRSQVAAARAEATRQVLEFWTGGPRKTTGKKRR
ncbi:hypothetical protein [Ramlibacter aurantiacus]|nr:hypothetical protein [Ramlibacter aurantiacus]